MEQKRIDWLDVAKGIAIILVVIGHVGTSYHASGQYTDALLVNGSVQFVYSFHMAVFMFISGLLFRKTDNNMSQIRKICVNYVIPYIIFQ